MTNASFFNLIIFIPIPILIPTPTPTPNPTASGSVKDWQTAFELIDQMLDLPESDRAKWVANLGAEQPHIKTMLNDLLNSRTAIETGGFLRALPVLDDHDLDADGSAKNAGSLVGAYRLIRQIGVGGMGAVWLAERADGLMKRQVALKLPFAGPQQQILAERFQRECDILASLTHKNIARLYDAGSSAAGQPYLAMEYIEGMPIDKYCDAKKYSVAQRLQLFRQVLSAVQYAHANLVLHRDLKPNNILVNHQDTVSLLDFGIAKIIANDEARETELTRQGGTALTPDYASPEQITGETLSTSSDVYSLGVILYELLAGVRPYKLKRGSRAELEEAIASADVPRPSAQVGRWQIQRAASPITPPTTDPTAQSAAHSATHSTSAVNELAAEQRQTTPQKLAQALAGDLDTIVLKALKKNPADRYATVAALDEDIARHQRGDAVLARPDSRWYRVQKFVARNKLIAVSVCAIFLALAAGMSVAIWQAEKARESESAARKAAEISYARATFWADLFADTTPKNHELPLLSVKQLLGQGDFVIEATLPDRSDLQTEVYVDLARAMRNVGSYRTAIPMYEKSVRKAIETYGDGSDKVDAYRFGLAIRYVWGMQHDRYFAIEPDVRKMCASVQNFSDVRCVRYANARSYALMMSGRLLEGEQIADAAIEHLRKAPNVDLYSINPISDLQGRMRLFRGDVIVGSSAIMRSLNVLRQPPKWQCHECLYYVVQVLNASGDIAAAKPFVEIFLAHHNDAIGEHNYVSNDLLRIAANTFSQLGESRTDHERSIRIYERAIEASELNYGPNNIDLAHSLRELGHAQARMQKFAEARAALSKAIPIFLSHGGAENHWLSEGRIALAGIDILEAKSQATIKATIENLRDEKARADKNHDFSNQALSLYWLAKAMPNTDESAVFATEALSIMQSHGTDRTLLALNLNLLLADHWAVFANIELGQIEASEVKKRAQTSAQKHAARAIHIANRLFGMAHPRAQMLKEKFSAADIANAGVAHADMARYDGAGFIETDKLVDQQNAEFKAYADGVVQALKKGKP